MPVSQSLTSSNRPSIRSSINYLHSHRLLMGSILILLCSLTLRLWQLDRFPYPVFDEVHFPKFAENYLQGNPPNDGHPPLGKYLIALGIVLLGHNEFGYRIASAIFGSLIPILAIAITYRLTWHRGTALLAGFLTLSDGLILVESRYGLLNVFLVAIGLVSQMYLLTSLERSGKERLWLLSLAGIMMGVCAGVKWNGAGFWLMTWLLIAIAIIIKLLKSTFSNFGLFHRRFERLEVLANLQWYEYVICLIILPIGAYVGQWVPHEMMILKIFAPQAQGWELVKAFGHHLWLSNQYILTWNTSIHSVGTEGHPIHPYCSGAATWPLLMRPVGYFFQPNSDQWLDVHALGNPLLWWLSAIAMIAIAILVIITKRSDILYIAVGYAANYFPWFIVKRCLFIYHYMSASVFSFIGLAIILSALYRNQNLLISAASSKIKSWQTAIPNVAVANLGKSLVVIAITLIVSAQIFFMPIWLGLPLSSSSFYARMWFLPNQSPSGFNWI